jgi:hypothetical protein
MATNNKDFRVKNGLIVEQDTNIGGDLVVTGTITGDGSGLSGVTSYTSTDFAADLATKTTTNLAEGTNLYYTNARFDTQLATKSTTNLAEGTNLYYTTARANTDFDSRLSLKSTSDLTEGTNLYYTDTRARGSLSAGSGISYDSLSGIIALDLISSPLTTSLVTESPSRLYYTDARVGDYLLNNAYATESYVTTQISNLVDSAPAALDTLNELAAALGDDENFATTITNALGDKFNTSDFDSTFDTRLATNIRTVNGNSLLGSGDLTIPGVTSIIPSTNTTIDSSDKGKYLNISSGITINTSTAFVSGDIVSVFNSSASSITITATGVTLHLAGTATVGNRTLAQRGLATILCVGSNTYVITGAGVT